MKQLVVVSSLLVLVSVPAAAQEDDRLEYLLEGEDRGRGDFTGRLTLVPEGPGRYRADRRVQFAQGAQALLGGRGQRVGTELRVLFAQGVGLAGAVEGKGAARVRLRAEFEGEQDEIVSTRTLAKPSTRAKGWGFRVFPVERPERAATTGSSFTYQQFKGVAFLKGAGDAHEVDLNDVRQGGLGDCYFMAGLAAVARTHPHRVRNMIETNPDGTFSVYLWKHNDQWEEEVVDAKGFYTPEVKATVIVVDDAFPTSFGTRPAYGKVGDTETVDGVAVQELWPMILEKAYAKHKKGYKTIEGGWASTPMSFFSGEDALRNYEPQTMSEAKLRAVLERAAKKGYPVTFGVPKRVPELSLVGNHYYFFAGLDEDGNAKLLNPWGSSHPPRPLTMAEIKAGIDMMHVGEF